MDAGRWVLARSDEIGPERFVIFAYELRREEASIDRIAGGGTWIHRDISSDPCLTSGLQDCVSLRLIGHNLNGGGLPQTIDNPLPHHRCVRFSVEGVDVDLLYLTQRIDSLGLSDQRHGEEEREKDR